MRIVLRSGSEDDSESYNNNNNNKYPKIKGLPLRNDDYNQGYYSHC